MARKTGASPRADPKSTLLLHPVPLVLSTEELEVKLQPTDATVHLTAGDRCNKVNKVNKPPRPATYAVKSEFTRYTAPRATIGKEEHFSSTFAGMFERTAECAYVLQCRDGHGPCYNASFTKNAQRAGRLLGSKRSQEDGGTIPAGAQQQRSQLTHLSAPRLAAETSHRRQAPIEQNWC